MLVRIEIEVDDALLARFVLNDEADVVGPFGEREVLKVVIAWLKKLPLYASAVDDRLDHARREQGEALRAGRADFAPGLEDVVETLGRNAGDGGRALETGRERL